MSDRTAILPHPAIARSNRRPRAAGFTLIEALMASVILAFSVAALMQAIGAGQMQTYQALHEARAAALNEAMLDELLSTGYSQLDAWHGYTQTPDEIIDAQGNRHTEPYQRFEQHVAVESHTVELPDFGTVMGKRITITLHDEKARQWVLHRFVRPTAGSDDEMEEITP